jgi:cyclomaltodextrinase / maltogenic alpha-amylase / neopullulanase
VRPVTRQEFLGAAGALTFAAAGCSVGGGGLDVAFSTLGGDAWTWRKQLAGTARGCKRLTLQAGGGSAAAQVTGKRFTGTARLGPGRNEVTARCSDGGSATLVLDERLASRPVARIDVSTNGRHVTLDASNSLPNEADGSPVKTYAWSVRSTNPAALPVPSESSPGFTAVAPGADGEYYVSVEVTDANGRADHSTTYFVVEQGTPRRVDMAREGPAWIDTAVIYGVIPFLFGDHGLRSVTAKLDYLRDLGINALWLSPILGSPPGDFGYAVTDYFDINPRYGTKADFKQLVDAAHERGIRVLMDFVPNHSSDQHPYFRDTVRHNRRSLYWDYYDRDASGNYTYYFDWQNLPNFNYSNAEMERFMLEAFAYWVREFDVDGFRTDAAWGVKRRRPGFWPRWRTFLKRIKPDLLLLAEASARDPYYFSHGFDVAYDWTDKLGHWAWANVFYYVPALPTTLTAALTNDGRGFADDAVIFRFLNNNDTGARFVSTYDPDTTRVAATLLLTLPGVPCVYTGDEVGAQYMPYEDQAPIEWRDEFGLRPWYKKLIHLRTATPQLHSRTWELVAVAPEKQGLFAYVRTLADGSRPLLVLLNFARDVFEAELSLPRSAAELAVAGSLRDLLGGPDVRPAGGSTLRVHIDALEAKILEAA